MANRLLDGKICVKCGNPTVDLNPMWGMCSSCQKAVEAKAIQLLLAKKARKGHSERRTIQTKYQQGSLQGVNQKINI